MRGRISPHLFSPTSTRSKRRLILLTVTAMWAVGCRREGAPQPVTAGFVRLEALTRLHPAWNEVRRLDGMLSRLSAPRTNDGAPASALIRIPMPTPLAVQRNADSKQSNVESARIDAVRGPAEQRVNELRNTLNAAALRAVDAENRRLQHELDAALLAEKQRLARDTDNARQEVERGANRAITDLGLKRIALQSQLDAFRNPIYPPEERVRIGKHLSEVIAKIENAQAALAGKLREIEAKSNSEWDKARVGLHAAFEQRIESFRTSRQQEVDRRVRSGQVEVGLILNTLEPLDRTPVQSTSQIRPLPLRSPSDLAQGAGPDMNYSNASGSSVKLAAQRASLVRYITADVSRRIQRLAAERRWLIAMSPSPGAADMTNQVGTILGSEWKP